MSEELRLLTLINWQVHLKVSDTAYQCMETSFLRHYVQYINFGHICDTHSESRAILFAIPKRGVLLTHNRTMKLLDQTGRMHSLNIYCQRKSE